VPELHRLRCFLAVAEDLNFSRAAERLRMGQPALSRQVRGLEEELEVELLVRTTHEVALTEAGEYLLANGPTVIEATEELWRSVGSFGDGGRGTLVFAFGTSAGYETAPRLLGAVAARLPDLRVSTRVLSHDEIFDGLAAGSIDAGLVRCAPAPGPQLEARLIRREPQGVLLRADHTLATAASVTLAQIAEEPILLHERASNPGHHDAVVGLFDAAGRPPKLVAPRLVTDLAYAQIVDGGAVSINGESMRDALPSTLRWVPLAPPVSFDVSLVVRAHRRPAAVDELLRAAEEAAVELGWRAPGGDSGSG
jgi:DNA-binding transcriptional LysR family regulator